MRTSRLIVGSTLVYALAACDEPHTEQDELPITVADASVDAAAPRADAALHDARRDAALSAPQEAFDGELETVGMGRAVGGFPVPVWLYKGGLAIDGKDAPLPIKSVAYAHQRANPDLWYPWRKTAEGFEVKLNRDWALLDYQDSYGPLPRGTTLDAAFSSENDTYTTTMYGFSNDDSFDYCDYIGLLHSGHRDSGKYEVDGYTIRLRYASGSEETLSFIHDPVAHPNTVWVDGTPYKRTRSGSAVSCH